MKTREEQNLPPARRPRRQRIKTHPAGCPCPAPRLQLLVLACAMIFAAAGRAPAEWFPGPAREGERVGVYVSNGDNELLYYSPPVDTKAAIDDFLEIMQEAYGVDTLYWRAAQIDQLINHSLHRMESRSHSEWITWMDHLFNEVGTLDYAIEAAHARGMEVWGVAALLDHGGAADTDVSKGHGPWFTESKLRVENPEWIPIDRYGIRRMSGPISLAYPEARRALVDLFTEIAVRAGYDGLLFHTYAEEFTTRFDDEFGYNQPAVADFERLTGVQVFANDRPFDEHAFAHLRGGYLTELIRELSASLRAHGIKLGLMLDSTTPWYPQKWGLRDIRVTGRLIVEWERFVREELVDLLWVNYHGPQIETVNRLLAVAEGTPTRMVMMHSAHYSDHLAHFGRRGVGRVIAGGYDHLHWGYLDEQPPEALREGNLSARLAVLNQMRKGETPFDLEAVIGATRDERVYVRRMALEVLREHGEGRPEAVAAAEAALRDPENPVRTYAVRALARIGNSASVDKIYDMLVARGNYMLKNIAGPWNLQTLPPERTDDLLRGIRHPHAMVRAAAVDACRSGVLRPEVVPAVIELAADPAHEMRWRAARVLGRFTADPAAREALFGLVEDESGVVRNMAALQLSRHLRGESYWLGPEAYRLFRILRGQFAEYGADSERPDAEWGWRATGEALERMGPRGAAALNTFLAQEEDPLLAERAWEILYVKLSGYEFLKITPAEAQRGYRAHPRVREAPPTLPDPPAESSMMPYLWQSFESEAFQQPEGTLTGNLRSHQGGWITHSRDYPHVRLGEEVVEGATNRFARATRGRGMLEGRRSDFGVDSGRLRIQADLRREQDDSAIWIAFAGERDRWRDSTLRVGIAADGTLSYRDGEGVNHATDTRLEPGAWSTLFIEADLDAETWLLDADTGEGRRRLAADISLAHQHPLNLLLFYPDGPEETATAVDNVRVWVDNPAHERRVIE